MPYMRRYHVEYDYLFQIEITDKKAKKMRIPKTNLSKKPYKNIPIEFSFDEESIIAYGHPK